jgi:hypothetical protein
MIRLWRALAFLAAAGAALFLSTAALAVAAGSNPTPAQPHWRMAVRPVTWSGKLTALYPGARDDTERFAVTITNAGKSAQVLHSVTASVASKANGCRADWFTVSIDGRDRRLPAQLAPGASYAAHVNLVMRDSATNQDSCRRTAPAVTVTAR